MIDVTMTITRMGEGGEYWTAGETYSATESFAKYLVGIGAATATFAPQDANRPAFVRRVGDGLELVMHDNTTSQVTGAWDDLRFPVQGVNPAGTAAPPTIDETLTDFPGTLLFAGNQENIIAGVAQMPHAWRAQSDIKPHIHWSKPVGSAAAVGWEFYYRHIGFPGDATEDWVGPVAGTLVAGDPTVSDAHCITSFGAVEMTGRRESSVICWQVRRQGATDADNGQARLFEFDIHYQVDKAGSVSEIPEAV